MSDLARLLQEATALHAMLPGLSGALAAGVLPLP